MFEVVALGGEKSEEEDCSHVCLKAHVEGLALRILREVGVEELYVTVTRVKPLACM